MKEGDGKSVTGRLTDRTYYLVADTKEACDLWVMMLHEMYPPPFHPRQQRYNKTQYDNNVTITHPPPAAPRTTRIFVKLCTVECVDVFGSELALESAKGWLLRVGC